MTTIMTSRGCPYQCIFCDRLGKVFRAASAHYVVKEIEHCLSLDIKELFFHDDTFTIDKKRVFEICRLVKEKSLKFTFPLRSRVNTIDDELMKELKSIGCKRISFGIESGEPRILKRIKKGITLEQAENAFKLTKKYKIITLADFMIGHPDETLEDIHQSIRFAKKIDPDYIQFSITTPYPGTPLYLEALKKGYIKSDVWKDFSNNPTLSFEPPRIEQNLSKEELHKLSNECYQRFYLRPSFILKEMIKTKNIKSLMKKIKAGFKLFIHGSLSKLGLSKGGFR